MKEIWKPVTGYEGYYSISNNGDVRSEKRRIFSTSGGKKLDSTISRGGYNLKKRKGNGRYYCVRLYKDKISTHKLIHRLIAESFIKNDGNKPYVNHKNSNTHDNTVGNLEWVTHRENMIHSVRMGRRNHLKGFNSGNTKLDEQDIKRIKYMISTGIKISDISNIFNVHKCTIYQIINGKHHSNKKELI